MFKGIVLKVTTEYAVILTDDNLFHKIVVKDGLIVGQKIFFFEEDVLGSLNTNAQVSWSDSFAKKTAAFIVMAACVIVFFLFNGIMNIDPKDNNYFAVVSIDINPSIQLKLNRENNVIGIEALNQEGKEISGNYLLGLKVDEAVSLVVKNAEKMNYLNPIQDTILVAMALNTTEEHQIQELVDQVTAIQVDTDYSYIIVSMEKDEVAKAKENNLSLGKYAMLDLSAGVFRAEEVRNMKTKELVTSKPIQAKLQQKDEIKPKNIPTDNAETTYIIKISPPGKKPEQILREKVEQGKGNQANPGQAISGEKTPNQNLKQLEQKKPNQKSYR